MGVSQSLIGRKFGRWEVIESAPKHNNHRMWKCRCDCGTEKIVYGCNLTTGKTLSCGCYHAERVCNKRKENTFSIHGDVVSASTQKGEKFTFDLVDMEAVKKYYWQKSYNGYIITYKGNDVIYLHRYLMNCSDDLVVDHINGDKTNCQRANMRICTASQNALNKKVTTDSKSGRVGVVWDKKANKWHAQIMYKAKTYHLGNYDNLNSAIKARIEAEKKYFGEFARHQEVAI